MYYTLRFTASSIIGQDGAATYIDYIQLENQMKLHKYSRPALVTPASCCALTCKALGSYRTVRRLVQALTLATLCDLIMEDNRGTFLLVDVYCIQTHKQAV